MDDNTWEKIQCAESCQKWGMIWVEGKCLGCEIKEFCAEYKKYAYMIDARDNGSKGLVQKCICKNRAEACDSVECPARKYCMYYESHKQTVGKSPSYIPEPEKIRIHEPFYTPRPSLYRGRQAGYKYVGDGWYENDNGGTDKYWDGEHWSHSL